MEYNKLSKKAVGCMRLAAAFGTILTASIIITARLIAYLSGISYFPPLDISLAVVLVLLLVYMIISPNIRYNRYKYLIDNEKVIVSEGLIFITTSFVPIERIHQITVNRGPIDRMYGLGKVIITTAGGTVVMRFLEAEKAEAIADRLRRTVSTIVRGQGVTSDE